MIECVRRAWKARGDDQGLTLGQQDVGVDEVPPISAECERLDALSDLLARLHVKVRSREAGRDRKQDHRHRCEEHGHGHHEALAHQQHEETGHGDHLKDQQPGGRIQKWPRYGVADDVNVTKQMARGVRILIGQVDAGAQDTMPNGHLGSCGPRVGQFATIIDARSDRGWFEGIDQEIEIVRIATIRQRRTPDVEIDGRDRRPSPRRSGTSWMCNKPASSTLTSRRVGSWGPRDGVPT